MINDEFDACICREIEKRTMRGESEGFVFKEGTRQTTYLLGTTSLYDGRTGRYEQ